MLASNFPDLDALLAKVVRPPRLPKPPEPKIFFDADRFRWWFRYGVKNPTYAADFAAVAARGNLQKTRDWLDAVMAAAPSEEHHI